MAEESTTRFESVIAGIRGYLTEQLSELERELDDARQSVTELNEQLAAKQSSIEVLVASRDLLAAKLNELDGVITESAVATLPGQLHAETEQPAAPQAEAVAAADVPDETPADAPAETATDAAEEKPATKARKLNAGQSQVLAFLEATPGVHQVSEIAAGVAGPDAGNAAAQAVRRALAVLTQAGLATKSTQSGTAFYSVAATEAPATAAATASTETAASTETTEAAEATGTAATTETAEATETTTTAPATRRARTRKAAPAKADAQQAAPKKTAKRPAAKRATAKTVAVAEEASSEAPVSIPRARKAGTAKGRATTAKVPVAEAAPSADAAEKTLRADRTRILATLQAAGEPQSAGEVSRTVMGDDWRTSDATNFRHVLKNMTTEGLVAEHLGDNNRTRYTAASGADLGTGAASPRPRRSRKQAAAQS